MPAARLPRRLRRILTRLGRVPQAVRKIGAPRAHDITPDIRARIGAQRGVH
jgi:hypothetical protein